MITKIEEQIKTGNIKNVARDGQNYNMNSPYVVIKETIDGLGRGIIFEIFCHFAPGQDLFLDDYMNNELIDLLDGFGDDDRFGNYNKIELLRDEQDINNLVTNNDDGTISGKRRFLMPSRFF